MASRPAAIRARSLSASAPGDAAPSEGLAARNVRALEQGLALFARLGRERYALVRPELAPSGIGGHFRHIHDYYGCFVRGLAAGRVDYDARERDPRFEAELAHATRAARRTIARLERLADGDGERELFVRMDHDTTADASWSRSTLRRELGFLLSHTIHHYALIRVLLAADGIACEPEFGVAPSTLDHWQRACAPSPGSGA